MNKQHPIPFDKVNITGGFWKDRIALNESVTLDSVRRRFEDTGRFSALSCEWKQGEPDRPHFFYDSDAAKWMEAAAYVLERKNDKQLESYVEDLIDRIERNMTPTDISMSGIPLSSRANASPTATTTNYTAPDILSKRRSPTMKPRASADSLI